MLELVIESTPLRVALNSIDSLESNDLSHDADSIVGYESNSRSLPPFSIQLHGLMLG